MWPEGTPPEEEWIGERGKRGGGKKVRQRKRPLVEYLSTNWQQKNEIIKMKRETNSTQKEQQRVAR